MTAPEQERMTQTPERVAQERATAEARRHRSAFQERYQAGVIDALDWCEGRGDNAHLGPSSGIPRLAADDGEMSSEWLWARDLNQEAHGTPPGDRHLGVAKAIAWYRRMTEETPA